MRRSSYHGSALDGQTVNQRGVAVPSAVDLEQNVAAPAPTYSEEHNYPAAQSFLSLVFAVSLKFQVSPSLLSLRPPVHVSRPVFLTSYIASNMTPITS